MEKKFYSVLEIAKILNISRQAVLKKIKNGQIKGEKAGRNFIVLKKDLREILDDDLTDKLKIEIKNGVAKIIKEYGETLKLLGQE